MTVDCFHNKHRRVIGYSEPSYPTVIVRLHLAGVAKIVPPPPRELAPGSGDLAAAIKERRPAYFAEAGGFTEVPVYDGEKLGAGDVVSGPVHHRGADDHPGASSRRDGDRRSRRQLHDHPERGERHGRHDHDRHRRGAPRRPAPPPEKRDWTRRRSRWCGTAWRACWTNQGRRSSTRHSPTCWPWFATSGSAGWTPRARSWWRPPTSPGTSSRRATPPAR